MLYFFLEMGDWRSRRVFMSVLRYLVGLKLGLWYTSSFMAKAGEEVTPPKVLALTLIALTLGAIPWIGHTKVYTVQVREWTRRRQFQIER